MSRTETIISKTKEKLLRRKCHLDAEIAVLQNDYKQREHESTRKALQTREAEIVDIKEYLRRIKNEP